MSLRYMLHHTMTQFFLKSAFLYSCVRKGTATRRHLTECLGLGELDSTSQLGESTGS